jgi:hypothetical protein
MTCAWARGWEGGNGSQLLVQLSPSEDTSAGCSKYLALLVTLEDGVNRYFEDADKPQAFNTAHL